jgi:Zn ribbon nucleic-acid-binding protein
MRNLAEWNAERSKHWSDARRKMSHPEEFGNGIACPTCGTELYDTGQAMSVSPTILRVKCIHCGFKGERFE